MASNTKISKDTKANLDAALNTLTSKVYSWDFAFDEMNGITVFMVTPFKGSNTFHIATSIMSPDEKKFRKSVGRAYAFKNYIEGKYIDTPAMVNLYIFQGI